MNIELSFAEKFLYHIWDGKHLHISLKTVDNKEIKVMYAGQWNTDSGPDFKFGIIQIDGEVCKGDIEIHKNTYDWINHKHQEDMNFNNVILHVVYNHNTQYPATILENGNLIPILEIKNQLSEDIKKLQDKFAGESFSRSEDFCSFFAGLDNNSIKMILVKLGLERLEKKINRFSAELYFTDFNQLFLQGLLESLGYSKNKFQMLQLSTLLPYNKLKEFKSKGLTKDQLIALWLGCSGLIEHIPATIPKEWSYKWSELYHNQSITSEYKNLEWKLFRIRPINHPVVRLLQVSDLIYKSLDDSLFNQLLNLFSFSRENFTISKFKKKLYKFFEIDWMELPENIHLGKTRIDTICINIILPLIILYARKMTYPDLESSAFQIFKDYNKLPENHITRHMNKFMQESQRKIISKKAIFQQGILKIYYDFCRNHNCIICKSRRNNLLGIDDVID